MTLEFIMDFEGCIVVRCVFLIICHLMCNDWTERPMDRNVVEHVGG